MRMREAAANSALVIGSLLISLVACEAAAQLVLNRADYLSVTVQSDPILGITIPPHSSGMDAWGFRNEGVPDASEIVAIGDSHTFGNTATMNDAWPMVVSRETGRTVYNLGLGGYGPNQYFRLFETRALSLHPKVVLVGLYMGDDFENAYSMTYGLDYWAFLRSRSAPAVEADIWLEAEQPGAFKKLRSWLSRESILYRVLVHGSVGGFLKEIIRFRIAEAQTDPQLTSLVVDTEQIREAFRPVGIASRVDQSSPQIKEGMSITFYLISEMNRLCREQHCQLGIVIIPTKETVFAEYLQRAPRLHLQEVIDQVVANERAARRELFTFLDAAGIPYVDTLPALKRAVHQRLYAPTTADMHPSGNGYRVIAGAVAPFVTVLLANR
jgi:hypothetical protein